MVPFPEDSFSARFCLVPPFINQTPSSPDERPFLAPRSSHQADAASIPSLSLIGSLPRHGPSQYGFFYCFWSQRLVSSFPGSSGLIAPVRTNSDRGPLWPLRDHPCGLSFPFCPLKLSEGRLVFFSLSCGGDSSHSIFSLQKFPRSR